MSVIEQACNFAIEVARDDARGYSQDANKRWGNPDFDCSSLVISAFKSAGLPLKSTYTGNMLGDFLNNGFEKVVINMATGEGLQRGDVLLNTKKHTALYIGDGQIVNATGSENGGKYGRSGDQTGNEIRIQPYYNKPWDCVLRYTGEKATTPTETESKGETKVMIELRQLQFGSKGADVRSLQILLNEKAHSKHLVVDGDFGRNTASVVADYQKQSGLVCDSIVGRNTWTALLTR